jgi:hypothetical protein
MSASGEGETRGHYCRIRRVLVEGRTLREEIREDYKCAVCDDDDDGDKLQE